MPSTLGELVAAVRGCHDAAVAYGAPFVSGKDSLNNEYVGADGRRHAVPPTLVITAVAHVPDVGRTVTAELTAPATCSCCSGGPRPSSPAATSTSCSARRPSPAPCRNPTPTRRPLPPAARGDPRRPRPVVPRRRARAGSPSPWPSCASPAGSGRRSTALPHDDLATALFAESTGRHVVEVRPDDVADLEAAVGPVVRLGVVTAEPVLAITGVAPIPVDELVAAFTGGAA